METHRLLLIALLPLASCGDVNHTATDYTQSNNKVATSGNDEILTLAPVVARRDPPLTPPPAPTAPATSALVSLAPDTSSTLRATVRLTSSGASTTVLATLTGGQPSTTYEGAVRRGQCTGIGSMVAPLVPATVDSGGTGRSSSRITVPLDSLWSAPHVLVFGPGGRPESCGSMPAAPPPPPPGATGEPDTLPPRSTPAAAPRDS